LLPYFFVQTVQMINWLWVIAIKVNATKNKTKVLPIAADKQYQFQCQKPNLGMKLLE